MSFRSVYENGGLIGQASRLSDRDYVIRHSVVGLAGKFFNGTWRTPIVTGNVGSLPLTTINDSSNVTGTTGLPSANHRYGVNLYTSIAYGDAATGIGDTYGFIAIGYFIPPTTGAYTFFTSSDDTSGVWVGDLASALYGRTAANATLSNGLGVTAGQGNTKRSATISLTANTVYPIRIVHEEGSVGDTLTFSWSGPGIAETTDLSYFRTPFVRGALVGDYLNLLEREYPDLPVGMQNLSSVLYSESPKPVVTNGLSLFLDAADPASYPGSGTTWFDISGNGRNATIVGAPTYSRPQFTNFSDSNYISLSNSGLVPFTNDFTYSTWLYFNSTDANDTIFENGSYGDCLLFRYENGNTLNVWAENGLRGSFTWTRSLTSWYNIVLRRSNSVTSCLINGVEAGAPFTMALDINLANTNLFLMRAQHTTGQFTNGGLSNFMVYNRALSDAEVRQNYAFFKKRNKF